MMDQNGHLWWCNSADFDPVIRESEWIPDINITQAHEVIQRMWKLFGHLVNIQGLPDGWEVTFEQYHQDGDVFVNPYVMATAKHFGYTICLAAKQALEWRWEREGRC